MSKKDIIKRFSGSYFTRKWLKWYLFKRTTKRKHRKRYENKED